MADDLEARLESHAQAFEGLLSLIPANEYYSKDNSDQWQRKKQTKEQKRQAKRAKLDPANQKSAKDVMDENERKRKRELGIESDNDNSMAVDPADEPEKPQEVSRKSKKQKTDPEQDADSEDDGTSKTAKVEKRKEKRRQKKEKADKQKQKLDAKKARKQEEKNEDSASDSDGNDDDEDVEETVDADAMDFSGLVDEDETSTPASPDQASSLLENSANQSAASSASSIVPSSTADAPSTTTNGTKPKKALALKLPEVNSEELQARLKARIEALRAQRKADGPNGANPRNRQELLESRRKKEEARKQHKKELRLKAKQEEERINNDRLHGSGSPLATPDIFSPRPIDENNFSFGRVAFGSDEEADPTLGSISAHKKKRGPSDVKTALQAAEKKAARLAGLDEDKRKEIEEKDLWLNAKKRAHGERIRDDQSLLKKTLKRKTNEKTKSATQWNERIDNVAKGKQAKDKRREENLAKRRDEKMAKKTGGHGKKTSAGKKKGRPGFEGRFKA